MDNHKHREKQMQRQFLLGWLSLMYFWSILGVVTRGWKHVFPNKRNLGAPFCGLPLQNGGGCVSLLQLGQAAKAELGLLAALTLLLAGFGTLLWINLSCADRPRLFWLFFLLQVMLALLTTAIVSTMGIAFVLLLILALEILFLFRRTALVFGVSCGAILLFILILVVIPPQENLFWLPSSWTSFGPLALWSFSGLATLLLFVVGYMAVYMQWISAHAQLETAHQELRTIHEELVAASSQIAVLTRLTERQRLARDLHDTLAQGLAGLIMQLQVADSYQKERFYDQAQATIEQTIQRARTTLAEARQTIDALRENSLEADELKQAIEQECAHFTSSTRIPCEVALQTRLTLPPALNEHILYVIKEGLSNIAHHAHAQRAWIGIRAEEQSVQVEIRDDGVGFDPATAERTKGHYGLLGLHERVGQYGGVFEIGNAPGEGTKLTLSFPLTGGEDMYDEDYSCRHCG